MELETYSIEQMTFEDVELAIDWAAEEGWNPGLYDAKCFYGADESGFLKGVLDGEMIASISVVKYGLEFAFLGFYIVKPEYRGQGYGYLLWQEAMKDVEGYNVALDGVVDQQPNYKKSGFKLAHRNIRFEGIKGKAVPTYKSVDLSQVPFHQLLEYDRQFFPAERKEFLKLWISRPQTKALGILDGQQLKGYGVIRKCRQGYKIGPVFAEDDKTAMMLIQDLISELKEGEAFFLDIPEVNKKARAITQALSMKSVFETARMYTKEQPDFDLSKIYGITSFELG